jgi:hypothetical protein
MQKCLAALLLSASLLAGLAGCFRVQKDGGEPDKVQAKDKPAKDGKETDKADKEKEALEQAKKDLYRIGEAFHNYANANQDAPPPWAFTDKAGKPLLSWRVAILPYLGPLQQQRGGAKPNGLVELYQKFKLDQPWDSEHNKKLLAEMPAEYAPRVGKTKEPYSTYYRVFVGEGATYNPKTGMARYRMNNIPDGTSNTIAVVEAAESVPWTKPDELVFDANKPLPKLGAQFEGRFLALMFDGSVRPASRQTDEKTLRIVITPDGGEIVPPEW